MDSTTAVLAVLAEMTARFNAKDAAWTSAVDPGLAEDSLGRQIDDQRSGDADDDGPQPS